ncbi:hypothetical protein [Nonomuraea sp. NPDC050310]|uniref:hypothetical protein n=1 Tax=unclassified Nonomuraea TaxID=2593643 RepID=UPI0033C37D32
MRGILLALVVLLTACSTGLPPGVVATVDGHPVVQAELDRALTGARAEVAAAHAGRIPADRLREAGMAAAVREKVLRLWAHEAGLLADPGEQAFQAALAAENERRARARAAGRPLPGVPSYDQHTYARIQAAELRNALESRIVLDETALSSHYRELTASVTAPPTYEEARERVRLSLARREFERALADRVAKAVVREP